MSEANLTAEIRTETGKGAARRFRRSGLVPAVVYGLGADAQPVSVGSRDLQHILSGASGANTLITLRVDGSEQLALAREIQRDPLRGDLVHVDFIRVRADQTVTAEVPLHLTGEPEGVSLGGLLEQSLFGLPIEARPADIPTAIEHDVSALNLGDQLRVGEIAIPAGVTVQLDADELVAQVVVPRGMDTGEEAEAAEEGAEGEAAPSGEAAGAGAEEAE